MQTTLTPQRCSRNITIEVPSDSVIGHRYTVTFTDAGTTCTCPGYTHRSRCKHLSRAAQLRCDWTSQDGERQTAAGFCPRCQAVAVAEPTLSGFAFVTVTLIPVPVGVPAQPATTASKPVAYGLMTGDGMARYCAPCLPGQVAQALVVAPLDAFDIAAHGPTTCQSCGGQLVGDDLLRAARVLIGAE